MKDSLAAVHAGPAQGAVSGHDNDPDGSLSSPSILNPAPANDNSRSLSTGTPILCGISAEALLATEFPPVRYVVPGYIVQGLTILGGRPKLGKSWMALNFAMAVSGGSYALGSIECEQGDVLYLALEDNHRRLQDRIRTLLPNLIERPDLRRLTLVTAAPRMDRGLVEALEGWREKVSDPRLIIVDTLQMVRPPSRGNRNIYEGDYAAVSPLQRYASETGLAVVLVTHVRKSEADDPLEMISGTNGLPSAAERPETARLWSAFVKPPLSGPVFGWFSKLFAGRVAAF